MKQFKFLSDSANASDASVSVSNSPKRKLDLLPRLVCLLIALLIWLWMVNLNVTDISETMILPIEYIGMENLDEKNMMIYGMDKNEITVTIQGSNRDLRKYDSSQYKAVVDVSKIHEKGQYTLPLNIVIPQDSSVKVSNTDVLNVSLYADESLTKDVLFDVSVEGSPSDYRYDGYKYNIFKNNTEKITIEGPKTIVDTIDMAKFVVNLSLTATQDHLRFTDFALTFLDKNSTRVNVDNGIISYTTHDVVVDISIIAYKNVKVEVDIEDNTSEYIPTVSVDTVRVYGAPSAIEMIDKYNITIPRVEGGTISHILTSDNFPAGVSVENEGTSIVISFEKTIGNE